MKKQDRILVIGKEVGSIKKEIYSMMGVIISAVAIPLSIITIYQRVDSSINSLWTALLLGILVITGLVFNSYIVISMGNKSRKFINHKSQNKDRRKRGRME